MSLAALQNHAMDVARLPSNSFVDRPFQPGQDHVGEDYMRNALPHIVITTNGADASPSLW